MMSAAAGEEEHSADSALRYFCHYCNKSIWRATRRANQNAEKAK
jgi:hypothetical protein